MYIVDCVVEGVEGKGVSPLTDFLLNDVSLTSDKDLYMWGDAKKALLVLIPNICHFHSHTAHSATLRDTGSPGHFQIVFSGPEIAYASLNANPDTATLQSEFNRITGRSDLVIKEVTTWQGEWR